MNYLKRAKQVLAGIVIVTFFTTNTLTPVSSAYAQQGAELPNPGKGIEIPAEFGRVTDLVAVPKSSHVLIHIQEAHGNYDAQKNIQNILQYLQKVYGVKLILVEGAGNKLKPELFKFFPKDPALQKTINEKFMEANELTGAEVFLMDSPKGTEGWGVENARAYAEDREAYREVFEGRTLTDSFLDGLFLEWQKKAGLHLNKDLRELVARYSSFEAGKIPLQDWLQTLKAAAAKSLRIDLSDKRQQVEWPILVRYFRLRELDGKIDFARVEQEKNEFLKNIQKIGTSSSGLGARKTGNQNESLFSEIEQVFEAAKKNELPIYKTRFVFERLMDQLPGDFSFDAYPNLRMYIQQIILLSELPVSSPDKAEPSFGGNEGGQGAGLQGESRSLVKRLVDSLAGTDEEKHYVRVLREYQLLKKLFQLELSREEFRTLKTRGIQPGTLAQSLGLQSSNLTKIESLFGTAIRFYGKAIERENWMIRNAILRINERKQAKAVLITGGFHTNGFKEKALEVGSSYVQITPALGGTVPEQQKNYLRTLLGTGQTGATPFFVSKTRVASAGGLKKSSLEPVPAAAAPLVPSAGVERANIKNALTSDRGFTMAMPDGSALSAIHRSEMIEIGRQVIASERPAQANELWPGYEGQLNLIFDQADAANAAALETIAHDNIQRELAAGEKRSISISDMPVPLRREPDVLSRSEAREPAVFAGTYRVNLDPKKRITVPAVFRKMMEEGTLLVLAPEAAGTGLRVYPLPTWRKMIEEGRPKDAAEARKYDDKVHRGVFLSATDVQGRVTLSEPISFGWLDGSVKTFEIAGAGDSFLVAPVAAKPGASRSEARAQIKEEQALWQVTKKIIEQVRSGSGWVKWAGAVNFYGDLLNMEEQSRRFSAFSTSRLGGYRAALLSKFFSSFLFNAQSAYRLSASGLGVGYDPRGIPVFLSPFYLDLSGFLERTAWRERNSKDRLWTVVRMAKDLDRVLAEAGLPALGALAKIKGLEPSLEEDAVPVDAGEERSFQSPGTPPEVLVWRVNGRKIGVSIGEKNFIVDGRDALLEKLRGVFKGEGSHLLPVADKELSIGYRTVRWNDPAMLEESLRETLALSSGSAVTASARSEVRAEVWQEAKEDAKRAVRPVWMILADPAFSAMAFWGLVYGQSSSAKIFWAALAAGAVVGLAHFIWKIKNIRRAPEELPGSRQIASLEALLQEARRELNRASVSLTGTRKDSPEYPRLLVSMQSVSSQVESLERKLDELRTPRSEVRAKILLAEDDPTVRGGVEWLFRKQRYEVVTAGSVEEAIDAYKKAERSEAPVELVISDWQMPDRNDGARLAKALRRLAPEFADGKTGAPLIFLTGAFFGPGQPDDVKAQKAMDELRQTGIVSTVFPRDGDYDELLSLVAKMTRSELRLGQEFLHAFVPMFFAVNALGVLPFVMAIMNSVEPQKRAKVIPGSMLTATCVAGVFLVLGDALLKILGLDTASFQIAGGIVLFAVSLQNMLGGRDARIVDPEEMSAVPIGVPFIVGPAVITTILALKAAHGFGMTAVVTLLNILIAGGVFYFGASIQRVLGKNGVKTLGKVAALLLATMGVAMVLKGLEIKFPAIVPRPEGTMPAALSGAGRSEVRTRPTEKQNAILKRFGFSWDRSTGNIVYTKKFEPLRLKSKIIFVRHGETRLMEFALKDGQRRYQGRADESVNQLSPRGREQAQAAAGVLKGLVNDIPNTVFFTSPLARSRETAAYSEKILGIKADIRSRLAEISYGRFENLTDEEVRFRFGETAYQQSEAYRKKSSALVSVGGGMSFVEFLELVADELVSIDRELDGKTGVVFGHATWGAAARILLEAHVEGPVPWREKFPAAADPFVLNAPPRSEARAEAFEASDRRILDNNTAALIKRLAFSGAIGTLADYLRGNRPARQVARRILRSPEDFEQVLDEAPLAAVLPVIRKALRVPARSEVRSASAPDAKTPASVSETFEGKIRSMLAVENRAGEVLEMARLSMKEGDGPLAFRIHELVESALLTEPSGSPLYQACAWLREQMREWQERFDVMKKAQEEKDYIDAALKAALTVERGRDPRTGNERLRAVYDEFSKKVADPVAAALLSLGFVFAAGGTIGDRKASVLKEYAAASETQKPLLAAVTAASAPFLLYSAFSSGASAVFDRFLAMGVEERTAAILTLAFFAQDTRKHKAMTADIFRERKIFRNEGYAEPAAAALAFLYAVLGRAEMTKARADFLNYKIPAAASRSEARGEILFSFKEDDLRRHANANAKVSEFLAARGVNEDGLHGSKVWAVSKAHNIKYTVTVPDIKEYLPFSLIDTLFQQSRLPDISAISALGAERFEERRNAVGAAQAVRSESRGGGINTGVERRESEQLLIDALTHGPRGNGPFNTGVLKAGPAGLIFVPPVQESASLRAVRDAGAGPVRSEARSGKEFPVPGSLQAAFKSVGDLVWVFLGKKTNPKSITLVNINSGETHLFPFPETINDWNKMQDRLHRAMSELGPKTDFTTELRNRTEGPEVWVLAEQRRSETRLRPPLPDGLSYENLRYQLEEGDRAADMVARYRYFLQYGLKKKAAALRAQITRLKNEAIEGSNLWKSTKWVLDAMEDGDRDFLISKNALLDTEEIPASFAAHRFLRAAGTPGAGELLKQWMENEPGLLERIRKISREQAVIPTDSRLFFARGGSKWTLNLSFSNRSATSYGDGPISYYFSEPKDPAGLPKLFLTHQEFFDLPLTVYPGQESRAKGVATVRDLLNTNGFAKIVADGLPFILETRFYYNKERQTLDMETKAVNPELLRDRVRFDAGGEWVLPHDKVPAIEAIPETGGNGNQLVLIARYYPSKNLGELSHEELVTLAHKRVPLIVLSQERSFKIWNTGMEEFQRPAALLPENSMRSEMRSWAETNAPALRDYTVVSRQLEAGLDRELLGHIRKRNSKGIAGLVAATTVTGGLGALMHDLFPSWQKNFGVPARWNLAEADPLVKRGTAERPLDAFTVNVIYDRIKGQEYAKDLPEEVTRGGKSLGDYLREALSEDPKLRLDISLDPGNEFRTKAEEWAVRTEDALYRSRLQQAREAVDRKIKVKVYPTRTFSGGMPNYYVEAFYIAEDGTKVQIFDEVYPDAPYLSPNLWRDLQMAVYGKITELLTLKLQGQGAVKKKILFVDNEVFVSIPTPLLPDALHHHMNHSVFTPTIYQPDESSLELLGYSKALQTYIVRDKKISIVDAVGMLFDLVTGVALYEHTPAVSGGVLPGYVDSVESYNRDGVRSTNGVLFEQWQSPLLRGLIDHYKKKVDMDPAADDKDFFEKLAAPGAEGLLSEFQERTDLVKAYLAGRLMLWLKKDQDKPLWFDQAMKVYQDKFGPAEAGGTKTVEDLHQRLREALAHENRWAELLADPKVQSLKEEFLGRAIITNVRRQVSYKGPDKWLEILRKLQADPSKLAWFKQHGPRAVIGGREFGADAHALFLEIQRLIRELGLEDNFATIENYNIEVAPVIFQGLSGTVMLSYELLEASATSMMKGVTNGGALIGVWGGAEPELFTIVEKETGREVNIMEEGTFKPAVSYEEIVKKLDSGEWKITNGFLVRYSQNGDGKFTLNTVSGGTIRQVDARPPAADSLVDALADLQAAYQDPAKRKALQWEVLRSSPKVDMEKSQARAHMNLWQKMIRDAEREQALFDGTGLSPQSALRFLSKRSQDDEGFVWRTEQSPNVVTASAGLLAFVESVRQLRTRGKGGYEAIAYHAVSRSDIFQRIFHYFSGFESEVPGFYQEMVRLKAEADATDDVLEKVRINLAALRLLDRFTIELSKNILKGYIDSKDKAYEAILGDDLFRKNLYFYLESKGHQFNSLNKSLTGFVFQDGDEKYIVALNLGEPKYPGVDGREPRAWGYFYGQKAFERLTGQSDPESPLTYQPVDAITGDVYGMGEDRKPYPSWVLVQGALPIGIPAPDIQILKLQVAGEMEPQEKKAQLQSLMLDDLRALVAGRPEEQLRQGMPRAYWVRNTVTYLQRHKPEDLKARLETVSGIKREKALEIFGAEGVRPVMAFITAVVPELLEEMKDWDREVYETLHKLITDPAMKGLFEKGEFFFNDASRDTAIVVSRVLKEDHEDFKVLRHVLLPIHFSKFPYNKDDGKVWFGIGSIARVGFSSEVVYKVKDHLLNQVYETKEHTLAGLLQKGWRVGIPVIKRKDMAGVLQQGWRFQVLEMIPTATLARSESRKGTGSGGEADEIRRQLEEIAGSAPDAGVRKTAKGFLAGSLATGGRKGGSEHDRAVRFVGENAASRSEARDAEGDRYTSELDGIGKEGIDGRDIAGELRAQGKPVTFIQADIRKNMNAGDIEERALDIADQIRNNQVIYLAPALNEQYDYGAYEENLIQMATAVIGPALEKVRKEEAVSHQPRQRKIFILRGMVDPGTSKMIYDTVKWNAHPQAGDDLDFDLVFQPDFTFLPAGKDKPSEPIAAFGVMREDDGKDAESQRKTREVLERVFGDYYKGTKIQFMRLRSAEMAKEMLLIYLGAKLAHFDDVAELSRAYGADLSAAAFGAGLDKRIRTLFTNPSLGFGGRLYVYLHWIYAQRLHKAAVEMEGKTHQKLSEREHKIDEEINAFAKRLEHGEDIGNILKELPPQLHMLFVLKTLLKVNRQNIKDFINLIVRETEEMRGEGFLRGAKVALLSVGYSTQGDKITASPALLLIKELFSKEGVTEFYIGEPAAENALREWVRQEGEENPRFRAVHFEFPGSIYEAAGKADVAIIPTDSNKALRDINIEELGRRLKGKPVFDGMNLFGLRADGTYQYKLEDVRRAGINLFGVGRSPLGPQVDGRLINGQKSDYRLSDSVVIRSVDEYRKALEERGAGLQAPASFRQKTVTVVGGGYVGLVTAANLAALGHKVRVVDIKSKQKEIDALNSPETAVPIYEPGLREMIIDGKEKGLITFSTDLAPAVRDSSIVYLAVGTPSQDTGEVDLQYILKASADVGDVILQHGGPKAIVIKSTVTPDTFEKMDDVLREKGLVLGKDYAPVSNPEFLREGQAIGDVTQPDRTVLGFYAALSARDRAAAEKEILELWYPLMVKHPHTVLLTDTASSTIVKYLANSFLAISITLSNLFAAAADWDAADFMEVRAPLAADERIGKNAFLASGIGYGGSCFPKDVLALYFRSKKTTGHELPLIDIATGLNDYYKSAIVTRMIDKVAAFPQAARPLEGKSVIMLGMAFKADTDDMREASSAYVLHGLLTQGAEQVRLHDPILSMPNVPAPEVVIGHFLDYLFKTFRGDADFQTSYQKYLAEHPAAAALNEAAYFKEHYFAEKFLKTGRVVFEPNLEKLGTADIVFLVTEWKQYKGADLSKFKRTDRKMWVVDGRNLFYERRDEIGRFADYMGVGTTLFLRPSGGARSETRDTVQPEVIIQRANMTASTLLEAWRHRNIPAKSLIFNRWGALARTLLQQMTAEEQNVRGEVAVLMKFLEAKRGLEKALRTTGQLTPSRSAQGQLQQKSDVPVPASPAGRRSAPTPNESAQLRQKPDASVRSEAREGSSEGKLDLNAVVEEVLKRLRPTLAETAAQVIVEMMKNGKPAQKSEASAQGQRPIVSLVPRVANSAPGVKETDPEKERFKKNLDHLSRNVRQPTPRQLLVREIRKKIDEDPELKEKWFSDARNIRERLAFAAEPKIRFNGFDEFDIKFALYGIHLADRYNLSEITIAEEGRSVDDDVKVIALALNPAMREQVLQFYESLDVFFTKYPRAAQALLTMEKGRTKLALANRVLSKQKFSRWPVPSYLRQPYEEVADREIYMPLTGEISGPIPYERPVTHTLLKAQGRDFTNQDRFFGRLLAQRFFEEMTKRFSLPVSAERLRVFVRANSNIFSGKEVPDYFTGDEKRLVREIGGKLMAFKKAALEGRLKGKAPASLQDVLPDFLTPVSFMGLDEFLFETLSFFLLDPAWLRASDPVTFEFWNAVTDGKFEDASVPASPAGRRSEARAVEDTVKTLKAQGVDVAALAKKWNASEQGNWVLVVDDHEALRNGVAQIVKGEKYQTVTASDVAAALEVIEKQLEQKQGRPLIVTDDSMPLVRGSEWIRLMEEQFDAPRMILLSSFIGTNPKAIQKELRTQDFPAIRLLDKINAFEELPGLLTQIKKADLTPSRSVQGQLQQKSDVPVPASPAGRRSAPIPSESVRPRQEPDVPVRSELRVPAVINTAEEFFRINQEKGGGTEYGVRAVMDKLTEGVAPLFAHAFNAAQKVLSFIDPAAYAYQDALDITAQPAMAVDRTRFAAARAVLSVQTMNASDAFVLGPEFAFDHGAIGVVRKVFGDIPLVVLTRDNGKDAAFLEKINAELVKANRPPILTASDLNAARSQLRKGRTAPLNLKAMVFATEPSAVMLKEQLKDDAILVTSRMFQNFLNLAGVTKLVERMQAEYLALARSA